MEFNFPGGKHIQQVTSLTLVNNTAKTVDISVPTYKRWKLLLLKVQNPDNVARDFNAYIYLEVAKTNYLRKLVAKAGLLANNGEHLQWPNQNTVGGQDKDELWHDIILEQFNTISLIWNAGGASAGGTNAQGIILEVLEAKVRI